MVLLQMNSSLRFYTVLLKKLHLILSKLGKFRGAVFFGPPCSTDPELPLLVELICEMTMVSDGLWCLTDQSFSSDDVADIIVLLCNG